MKKIALVSSLVFCILSLLPALVQAADEEVFLGARTVNFKTERDEIPVTGMRGPFSKLLFRVEGNDLEMFKVIVVFGNGQRKVIPVKLFFREGERSRTIDLPGRKRVVRGIVFYYRTVGRIVEGRAEVKVFGIR